MSTEQLSHLSLSAINSLTRAQRSSLNHDQIEAIRGTVKTLGSVLNNGSSMRYTTRLKVTLMFSTFISIITSSVFKQCMNIL